MKKLAMVGISISRQTLRRYEQQKLISEPKRGSGGRGVGRWTDYEAVSLHEAWAASLLLSGEWVNYATLDIFGSPASFRPASIAWMRRTYYETGAIWRNSLENILKSDNEFLTPYDRLGEVVTVSLSMGFTALYGLLLEKAKRM